MKLLLCLTLILPLWAQEDSYHLKSILSMYYREEQISTRHDEYHVVEKYDLDISPIAPCQVVLVNRIEYSYEQNYHNDRIVTTRYYLDLGRLESSPIIESLEEERSSLIPLRAFGEKIQSFIKTTYKSGSAYKNGQKLNLVMVKFQSPSLRIKFGHTLLNVIESCRGYL